MKLSNLKISSHISTQRPSTYPRGTWGHFVETRGGVGKSGGRERKSGNNISETRKDRGKVTAVLSRRHDKFISTGNNQKFYARGPLHIYTPLPVGTAELEISTSEYLRYASKCAITRLNHQKFSREPHPTPSRRLRCLAPSAPRHPPN